MNSLIQRIWTRKNATASTDDLSPIDTLDDYLVSALSQLTSLGKKDQLGLGLGLAITYRLIESLQGTISVSNRDPSGCLFRIALPFSDGE